MYSFISNCHFVHYFQVNIIIISVDGRGTPGGPERDDLYGGARISYIFNEVFVRTMRALDPFEGLDDEDIRVAIGYFIVGVFCLYL
jgi:hypothetical protein